MRSSESRRVVVTGMGLVSGLGDHLEGGLSALRSGVAGTKISQEAVEHDLRCQVACTPDIDASKSIERKVLRMASMAGAYMWLAAEEAVEYSGLSKELVASEDTACIVSDGGSGLRATGNALEVVRNKGVRRLSPFIVPQAMNNNCSALLSTYMGLKGPSFSVSSACATGTHSIGTACEFIRSGVSERAIAGGAEESFWLTSAIFDAMGALTRTGHECPQKASRPYDKTRDGFVPGSGGAALVLEEREAALKRGANILGEIVGYGATSDGYDMVAPSGEGAMRCMQQATRSLDSAPDYINTHGTSTPAGDIVELQAIRQVFGDQMPAVSSTKALTGHALGAAGAMEAVFCLLMLRDDFIVPCYNIDELDPEAEGYPLQRELANNAGLRRVMSNSFGFGGTNAALVFDKHD